MQIIDAATQTEALKEQLKESSLRLSQALETILSMLRLRFKLAD